METFYDTDANLSDIGYIFQTPFHMKLQNLNVCIKRENIHRGCKLEAHMGTVIDNPVLNFNVIVFLFFFIKISYFAQQVYKSTEQNFTLKKNRKIC